MDRKSKNMIIAVISGVFVLGGSAILFSAKQVQPAKKIDNLYYSVNKITPQDIVDDTVPEDDLTLSEITEKEPILPESEKKLETVIPEKNPDQLLATRESVAKNWFDLRDTKEILDLEPFYTSLKQSLIAEEYPQILSKFDYIPLEESSTGFTGNFLSRGSESVLAVMVVLPEQYTKRFVLAVRSGSDVSILDGVDILYDNMFVSGDSLLLTGSVPTDQTEAVSVSLLNLDTLNFENLNSSMINIDGIRCYTKNNVLSLESKTGAVIPAFVINASDDPEFPEELLFYAQTKDTTESYRPIWLDGKLSLEKVEG